MEDLLKQIVKNTDHKTSFQIIVSDNKTRFRTRFNRPIQLEKDKKYEIALVNLETYYSFPNIDATNNMFIYSPDNGASWVKIEIPEGSYDLIDINDTIHQEMRKKDHYDEVNDEYHINTSANTNTLKSVLTLEDGYQVDFNHPNSISKVLGFTHAKYTHGFHESENVVNILSINSLLVNIDIISGSYVNGSTKNTIYFNTLQYAVKAGCPVSIRLGHENLQGNDIIAITDSQAKKMAKAYENGKGITIRMSAKQLKHNMKIEGGFLGMLAGLAARALPMIAKTVLPALGVGALSGLASSGVQKAMGSGLYLTKGGCVCQIETDGKGLYLGPAKGLESLLVIVCN